MAKTRKTSPRKSKSGNANYDIVIVGGGPVGLAFAAALKHLDLRLCLIEKQGREVLANPAFDGRDIALTHSSKKILGDLDILPRIPADEFSPIKRAHVLNGTSPYALKFDSRDMHKDALGYLISNHLVRKAAYEAVKKQPRLDIRTGIEVTDLHVSDNESVVMLSNGDRITAPLVVAADSRFSACRRMMGVPVSMRDFGRTVVVCRVKHPKPHHNVAYECFHYGRTLAVLPLAGNMSSVVITLPSDQAPALLALSEKEFNKDVTERFGHQLGPMALTGKRHSYPLVATYADRFSSPRFALLGDSAVGMHPVTAHGYNFGLYGVRALAGEIEKAIGLGLDIGSATLLERYNKVHRRATLPLYMGTNTLVGLYTKETPSARLMRGALLRLGNFTVPFKRLVTQQLTQTKLAG